MVSQWFTVSWEKHQERRVSCVEPFKRGDTEWQRQDTAEQFPADCLIPGRYSVIPLFSIVHSGLGGYYILSVVHQSAHGVLKFGFWSGRDFV